MFLTGGVGLTLLKNQIVLYNTTIISFKNHSFLHMSMYVHKEISRRYPTLTMLTSRGRKKGHSKT